MRHLKKNLFRKDLIFGKIKEIEIFKRKSCFDLVLLHIGNMKINHFVL